MRIPSSRGTPLRPGDGATAVLGDELVDRSAEDVVARHRSNLGQQFRFRERIRRDRLGVAVHAITDHALAVHVGQLALQFAPRGRCGGGAVVDFRKYKERLPGAMDRPQRLHLTCGTGRRANGLGSRIRRNHSEHGDPTSRYASNRPPRRHTATTHWSSLPLFDGRCRPDSFSANSIAASRQADVVDLEENACGVLARVDRRKSNRPGRIRTPDQGIMSPLL